MSGGGRVGQREGGREGGRQRGREERRGEEIRGACSSLCIEGCGGCNCFVHVDLVWLGLEVVEDGLQLRVLLLQHCDTLFHVPL